MRAGAVSPRHHLPPNPPLGAGSRSHLEKTACESGENRRERCCDIAFLRGSPGCKPALKRVFAFSDAAIAITAIIPTNPQRADLRWFRMQENPLLGFSRNTQHTLRLALSVCAISNTRLVCNLSTVSRCNPDFPDMRLPPACSRFGGNFDASTG